MRSVFVLGLASLAGLSIAVQYGPGAGGVVPDNNAAGFSSTISIPTAILSVQSVEIRGLRHTFAGDVIIRLLGPNGATVSLVDRVGVPASTFGEGSNFGGDGAGSDAAALLGRDYTFAVGGADLIAAFAAIDSATGLAGGTYAPTAADNSLTNFSGVSNVSAGNWTLTISDNAAGDINGQFTEWYINATPVPEPATMVALGLGALALLRKRRK